MKTILKHLQLADFWIRSMWGPQEKIFAAIVAVAWFFPEFYGEQLFVVAAAVAAAFICRLPYAWSLKCLVIYHVVSTCLFLAFRDGFTPAIATNVDLAMSRVLVLEIALVMAVLIFARIRPAIFGGLAVVGAVMALCGSGLTYVTTMHTTFLAVLLPLVPPLFLPVVLAAIILERGALSYGIVALHLLYFGIFFKNRIYLALFVVGVVCGGAYLGESIYCSGRSAFYSIVLYDWWHSHTLLGSGLGSFQVLGPLLQKAHHIDPGRYWLSLHNEWLQALFETGPAGVALLLWVFCDFLWRQRREPILFSTMLALGGAGVFYYPFKIPIFALVFAVLVAEGLRK